MADQVQSTVVNAGATVAVVALFTGAAPLFIPIAIGTAVVAALLRKKEGS